MAYEDKVVIITGGTKGIGLGCVRAFVEARSKVVFCARKQEEGDALAADLSARSDAFFVKCDVSKSEEIQDLIEKAIKKYGRIDCLINNAGSHPQHMPIDDFSVQDFRDLLDLNLVSMFAACKYALPQVTSSICRALSGRWDSFMR